MASEGDEIKKSEEQEGLGAVVDRVIIFNVGMGKFDLFPVAGYPGGDSLATSTGMDMEIPLSYNDRNRDVSLNYSATTTVKARIFLRFERGKLTTTFATKNVYSCLIFLKHSYLLFVENNVKFSFSGNEMTMVMGAVTALNDEIGSVADDMVFDHYLEMLDCYKEFVARGKKIRHRNSRDEPFPEAERIVYGKNIDHASVSIDVSDLK